MSTLRKSGKPKLSAVINQELINDSYSLKKSPKTKKTQKRPRNEATEEENISNLIGLYAEKENAVDECKENTNKKCKENTRQTLLDVMDHQLMTRKNTNTNLLKNLSEVVTELENDHEVLKDNEQKIAHFSGALVQCLKQATAAQSQKLKTLKDIYASYKKECEVMEKTHKAETEKLAIDLEEHMKNQQQKLVAETKRKQVENFRRSILQFQDD